MNGLTVTELHTQDGWDWPNGVSDERWPAQAVRAVPCLTCAANHYCPTHKPAPVMRVEKWPSLDSLKLRGDPFTVRACRWPECDCHGPQGPHECRRRAATE